MLYEVITRSPRPTTNPEPLMPYIPHTPEEVREMLDVIGVSRIDDLFAEIPEALRPKSFNLPAGMTEIV